MPCLQKHFTRPLPPKKWSFIDPHKYHKKGVLSFTKKIRMVIIFDVHYSECVGPWEAPPTKPIPFLKWQEQHQNA